MDVDIDLDSMWWLMPVGLALGIVVMLVFERKTHGSDTTRREAFKKLTKREELGSSVEAALSRRVNGISTVFDFWTGGCFLRSECENPEAYKKIYEMLALVSALMLAICVTFYTATPTHEHTYGLVCCVANCALWMATLSSAFFSTVMGVCQNRAQLEVLLGMYGKYLMRVPMMLFVWGWALLFLEFVLFFKINVDPGFNCFMCLAACFVPFPTFLHCMHKMGWAARLVVEDERERKRRVVTMLDLRLSFQDYLKSKKHNPLALDKEEFLESFGFKLTSVQTKFSAKVFDDYVEAELQRTDGSPSPSIPSLSTPGELKKVI